MDLTCYFVVSTPKLSFVTTRWFMVYLAMRWCLPPVQAAAVVCLVRLRRGPHSCWCGSRGRFSLTLFRRIVGSRGGASQRRTAAWMPGREWEIDVGLIVSTHNQPKYYSSQADRLDCYRTWVPLSSYPKILDRLGFGLSYPGILHRFTSKLGQPDSLQHNHPDNAIFKNGQWSFLFLMPYNSFFHC